MASAFFRFVLSFAAAAAVAACAPSTQENATVGPAKAPVATGAASAAPATAQPLASRAGMPDFTALVDKVGPAVVNVTTSRTLSGGAGMQGPSGDPLFEFFRRFMPPNGGGGGGGGGGPEFRSRGVGSGFIIDAEGYVLTNAHVVADADEVVVRLADSKEEYKAKVVGVDPQTDVALLKLDKQGLPVAPISTTNALRAGEWVAAIGSPFGFSNTITAGIVSATERSLPDENFVPFIQTDVAVNPGNSGGPLLNMDGEVVGINSQIYSRTGGYMGVSFAIPIDVAMDIAGQLRTQGRVSRGRLGVGIQEVSQQLAESFKLDKARGAVVTAVEPESPAQQAGMAVGDIITRFNGKEVEDAKDLPLMVGQTKPGTEVDVEVWRGGKSQTMKLKVGEAETSAARAASPASGPGAGATGRLGLAVSELPPAGRRALGVDYGLVVERVEGVNADVPLQPGDVIIAINNQRFRSLDEFNRHVAEAEPGSTVALLIRRGEATAYVPVTVGQG
ncbi:Do family serine endopeptidase [Piscinibacter sp.]|uniref:Do family serine endopeptidase n=1 Tax=Piscinibacter sp. TaxID=1903157 RepID=UPI002C37492F|nr:Do family serine endopeptidase [Albitalea sp.]HUG21029.1 Do family serine endopeptidase [Albitalea sp.]